MHRSNIIIFAMPHNNRNLVGQAVMQA